MRVYSAAWLASQKVETRRAFLAGLSIDELTALTYDWQFWARDSQLPPPGDWSTWLILTGRGWGKNRTGGEWVRSLVDQHRAGRIALVARTAADVRDVMVEGESGILAISPPWARPKWEPSKRRLTWQDGAIATTYSADEPDVLRGPQHDAALADEVASWKYRGAWDNLLLGLRIGVDPRVVVTTTPRPTALIKALIKDVRTYVTRGTTYENLPNLTGRFREQVLARYEGTRLGRQEIHGEVLSDTPGALWTQALLDANRVAVAPPLVRVVIAIDPAVTATEDSDETGIIAAGLGTDGHGYVLEDRSGRYSPHAWASQAIAAYHALKADRIIGEANNGGDLVEYTLRSVDPDIPYRKVVASRGKVTRAEPIAALDEQGRIHHVGALPQLEDQMTTWVPGEASPDRMDARVWALTELVQASRTPTVMRVR